MVHQYGCGMVLSVPLPAVPSFIPTNARDAARQDQENCDQECEEEEEEADAEKQDANAVGKAGRKGKKRKGPKKQPLGINTVEHVPDRNVSWW